MKKFWTSSGNICHEGNGPAEWKPLTRLRRQFNSREQLTQFNMLDWNHADNSPYYVQWQWFYDYGTANNNGNLLSVRESNSPSKISTPSTSLSPVVTTSFTYDGVNRLASVTDNSYSRSMCYDTFGNSWVSAYSGTPSLPGNAPKQIGVACSASGAAPYVAGTNKLTGVPYDSNGNETNFRSNTLTYDAENRMVSVMSGTNPLASFQYDGDGRRVQKTTPTGTTTYVYDASGALMAEYTGSGTALSKEYVRFHSSFVGSNVDLVSIENAPGNGAPCTTCFVIPDYLGNVRMMADNAGHAVSRHDYLPFGEEASADPNRPTAAGFGLGDGAVQRFTGKERDSESGLDNFGARYYGSALGRFTSADEFKGGIVDPVTGQDIETNTALPYADISDPQTLNKYAYVRNNPLRYTDPNGHCIEDLCIGEGALVYAGYTALAGATAAFLASPTGQQSLDAAGQLIQTGLNSIGTLADGVASLGTTVFSKNSVIGEAAAGAKGAIGAAEEVNKQAEAALGSGAATGAAADKLADHVSDQKAGVKATKTAVAGLLGAKGKASTEKALKEVNKQADLLKGHTKDIAQQLNKIAKSDN